MKASELIGELQKFIEKDGDLEVFRMFGKYGLKRKVVHVYTTITEDADKYIVID